MPHLDKVLVTVDLVDDLTGESWKAEFETESHDPEEWKRIALLGLESVKGHAYRIVGLKSSSIFVQGEFSPKEIDPPGACTGPDAREVYQ